MHSRRRTTHSRSKAAAAGAQTSIHIASSATDVPQPSPFKGHTCVPAASTLLATALSRQSSSSELSWDTSPDAVVWPEDMEVDERRQEGSDDSSDLDAETGEHLNHDVGLLKQDKIAADSFASSLSVLSDLSDISSLPSTESSKATTPAEAISSKDRLSDDASQTTPRRASSYRHDIDRLAFNVRPKSSVPPNMTPRKYAGECLAAAESSRLNPYALHPEEYQLFRHHISHAQVTTYLNIRNGILRLWMSQPQVCVTRQAAIGCANARWFDAASVCYDWLVRRGYINFGCVELPESQDDSDGSGLEKPKVIAVIGAGISGLGCARQLENLFHQYAEEFLNRGETPPKVVVLEGRSRVGGRVYSREFKTKLPQSLPEFESKRCTAEMGGMIVTGFERGNPMNILIRGQLGIPYHPLTPETTIYDSNGKPVDLERDQLVEKLYNDCLDRVSEFKHKTKPSKFIEGNRELINDGRDSHGDGSKTIMQTEEATAALPDALPVSQQNVPERVNMVPVSSDRVTGRVHTQPGVPTTLKASDKARLMGWEVKPGPSANDNIDLGPPASTTGSTLGSVLDYAISRYRDMVDLNAQDHRLLNWHIANLEYSNATNLHKLSLPLWDIDAGNEWEGHHTMVVGGYQSVARGLLQCPKPLNIKTSFPVKSIKYNPADVEGSSIITCEDGTVVEADIVVSTVPLGVLKHQSITFDPPLPSWKTDAINRLGFGILNKVILVYEKPFWDPSRHIFGVLRDAPNRHSTAQKDYGINRGRFFQWFNTSATTGLPCLVALMAGDAGYDTEHSNNDSLVAEAIEILRNVFGNHVPYPVETMITRWGSDRFARGSYSSAAPEMQPEDYNLMASSAGNLFFAGEHTIGTHPATVHGAYMSGLRAASEVLDGLIGAIEVPTPLILPKDSLLLHKRKQSALDPKQARLEAYELEVWDYTRSRIGERPIQPVKSATNAYIIFSKVKFEAVRKQCERNRKPGKNRSLPNEVRIVTSRMWKDASPEERKPYEDQAAENKRLYTNEMQLYASALEKWDQQATALRAEYEKIHPIGDDAYAPNIGEGRGEHKQRRSRNVSYAGRDSDS